MLTPSLRIDTLAALAPDMWVCISHLRSCLGAGPFITRCIIPLIPTSINMYLFLLGGILSYLTNAMSPILFVSCLATHLRLCQLLCPPLDLEKEACHVVLCIGCLPDLHGSHLPRSLILAS